MTASSRTASPKACPVVAPRTLARATSPALASAVMAATTTRISRARAASWTSARSTGTVRAWRSASALATRSASPVRTVALGLLTRSTSATWPRAAGTALASARRTRSGWMKWSKRARMSIVPLSTTGSRSALARNTASMGGCSLSSGGGGK